MTSAVTLERTSSDTSYQKYEALVALLFWIYLVNLTILHYTSKKWMRSFFSSSPVSLQWCYRASKVTSGPLWTLLCSSTLDPLLLYHFLLRSTGLNPKTLPLHHPIAPRSITRCPFWTPSSSTWPSINFFDFPDNLLLKDGQDSIIFTYLFKHHPTVKLVAYLLEIIPKKGKEQR